MRTTTPITPSTTATGWAALADLRRNLSARHCRQRVPRTATSRGLRSGAANGPRLFTTAEAVDGERVYYPMMIPTTSEAQLHREFARLKALDFDFVKLYVRLPFAWAEQGYQFAHEPDGRGDRVALSVARCDALGEDGMSHISATSRTGYAYSRSFTGHSYSDVRTFS